MSPGSRSSLSESPEARRPGPGSSSSHSVTAGRATSPATAAGGKRQRVSLACDHCRAARGRCDGRRPSCGSCLSSRRDCSYTSSRRRRGTPTGYLRAVESSLAYLVQQSPDNARHLERLLRTGADVFAAHPTPAGDQLHKQWTNSRFRKDMWALLVDGYRSEPDTDGSVKDEEAAGGAGDDLLTPAPGMNPSLNSVPASAPVNYAQLPGNWRRLLDVYFTYTHCWLPILDRDAVMEAALSYPPHGIPAVQIANVPSAYAELWAALALASFQDSDPTMGLAGACSGPLPKAIYSVARNMMPSEEKRFELPHLRAILLHSLVLMGQGSGLAAWMLIGTALRLGLHLRETGDLYSYGRPPSANAGHLAFAACFVLNTLASAYLGQPTFLSVDTKQLTQAIMAMGETAEDEAWVPISGDVTAAQASCPLRVFRQLYKMAQMLHNYRASTPTYPATNSSTGTTPRPTTQTLIAGLDPRFSFCNSLIVMGQQTTPAIPSASVLHACFLAVLTQCEPGHRASLLPSLRDVVESCVATFGPRGVPPVMVCLAGTALRSRHAVGIDASERARWERVAGLLRMVWTGSASGHNTHFQAAAADDGIPTTSYQETHGVLDIPLEQPGVLYDGAGAGTGAGWDGQGATQGAYDPFLGELGTPWPDGSYTM